MAGISRFPKAKRVLSGTAGAEQAKTKTIGTEHMLLGMCIEEGTAAKRVLDELGIELESLRAVLAEMREKTETEPEETTGGLGEDVKRMLEQALAEALTENASMVGTEHLIMAMARDESSTAMRALAMLGVNATQLERQTARVMEEYQRMQEEIQKEEKKDELEKSDVISRRGVSRRKEKDEGKTPLVDQLATDLTSLAEAGKLDPVIGRTKEIERVIQILARRTKNNPALIGEPGVGKTAIVEGLAQRIIEGDVPALLLDKRVLQLDVGSMVAGTMYRGQFEERLKRVIDELKSSGDIIFIDEVHMLVGAGSAGSSVDAANILKPALSRGESGIGATTATNIAKTLKVAALERRFNPLWWNSPAWKKPLSPWSAPEL